MAKVWDVVSNPWKIPVILKTPPALSDGQAIEALFPQLTSASIDSCRLELLSNDRFFTELNHAMIEKRHRRIIHRAWYDFLYMAVRFTNAEIVFETGVFDGESSAAILQALHDNGKGLLVSIDLPATEAIPWSTQCMRETVLPPNCQPGWVIPTYLRDRHRLVLGDSTEELPRLLNQYPTIDLFLHDSLHTLAHQYFEYTTAWPHLPEGGLLLSDDIFWNAAWHRFCRAKRRTYVHLGTCGAVKK